MVKISDAELEVLKVIWKKEETTSNEIIKEVESFNWSSNTVRTLIRRLEKKGAIQSIKKDGKSYIYKPVYDKEEYRVQVTKGLLKKLYNNSAKEMLLTFCQAGDLTAKDLDEIVQQIEK